MSIEVIIVLVVLAAAIILFITEKLPVDLVAILIMTTLILSGVITPLEGVAGFSNEATITVAAMFVLSAGLIKTGVVNIIGKWLARIFRFNFWIGVIFLMLVIGFISAFINNTPVVAIFIPLVMQAAAASKHPSSKLLMPLSFASMFGGVCTLIGTSTNILVSSIAVQNGLRPFDMFEMTPLGAIFFLTGTAYMIFFGIRLIPDRKEDTDLTEKFSMGKYLTEIVLLPQAASVGKKLGKSPLVTELDIDVLEIVRYGYGFHPTADTLLRADDVLRVRCDVEKIKTLQQRAGILLKSEKEMTDEQRNQSLRMVEAVIPPHSELEGKTLKEIGFRNRFGVTTLAIRHRGEVMHDNIGKTPLKAGDTLLIEASKERLQFLKQRQAREKTPFLIISEIDFPEFRRGKTLIVILIMAAVITSASSNVMPIMLAAIIGCVAMVLTGSLNMEEAYRSIEWKVIFLLAGALSLGLAMQKSGTANLLSDFLVNIVGSLGPVTVVSVLYLVTSLLTEVMSNNASAVLLAPIALGAAEAMEVDARPFLMAIAFAASASFMTPVGYQTNTMIYGTGKYKFKDFIRVGAPLNLIFWILATLLIPYFFPFK